MTAAKRYLVAVQISTVQRKTIHVEIEAAKRSIAEAEAAALIRNEFGPGTHNDPPPPLTRIAWRVDKAEATQVEEQQ
jgi:hypothetical protein